MTINYFKTNDLALGAVLLCLNQPILTIDKSNLRKVVFVFEANDQINKHINKYWKHELLVDPINYFNALKELKTRIYENKYINDYDNTKYQKS